MSKILISSKSNRIELNENSVHFVRLLKDPDPPEPALELTYVSIDDVPVADAYSLNDWNAALDLPTNGNPFTSVESNVLTGKINYGFLYNWYAIADARGFTSSDEWYIPERTLDVVKLFNYLGGNSIAGGKLKETGLVYWIDTNTGATNEVGFNGRGSGYRGFTYLQRTLTIWTSTVYSSYAAWYAQMGINNTAGTSTSIQNMIIGMAVRLIRPATEAEQLLADGSACAPYVGNDGKIYPTVKIGTQVWTAANSAETKYRDGDYIPGFDGGVYTPISNEAWAALTTGALCAYDDNIDNAYTTNCLIRLIGGSNIVIKTGIFRYNPILESNDTNLISFVDTGCCIEFSIEAFAKYTGLVLSLIKVSSPTVTKIGIQCFMEQWNLFDVYLPSVIEIGSQSFFGACFGATLTLPSLTHVPEHGLFVCLAKIINLPLVTTMEPYGAYSFDHLEEFYAPLLVNVPMLTLSASPKLRIIDLSSCEQLGNTVGYNAVFSGLTGQTVTLTIPATLMTCNGGNPDGDIQTLIANNTVTIITV